MDTKQTVRPSFFKRFTLAAAHYRTIVHPAAHGDARTLVTLRYAR